MSHPSTSQVLLDQAVLDLPTATNHPAYRLQELTGLLNALVESESRYRALDELEKAAGNCSPLHDFSITLRGVIEFLEKEIMEIRTSTELLPADSSHCPDKVVQEMFHLQINAVKPKFTSADPRVNIKLLPKELQDNILLQLIKIQVLPGKIFRSQSPDGYGVYHNGDSIMRYPPLNVDIFRALDRHWAAKAKELLYSSNTWVVGEGEEHTVQFLQSFPQEILDLIVSVEINLSWRDVQWTGWLGDWATFLHRMWVEAEANGEDLDVAAARRHYDRDVAHNRLWMLRVWQKKLEGIKDLPLKHLRLNFMTACDLDDNFLGTRFAETLMPNFTHGVPENLEIIAPRKRQENEIRELIIHRHEVD